MTNEESLDSLLSRFPVTLALPVFWGDQDAFGHVNNKVTFRWLESARIEYFGQIGLLELHRTERIGPILASVTCDFRRQLHFPDTIHVGIRATKIGRTSLALEHAVFSQGEIAVAAEGHSTIVVFDYRANKPTPVPATVRAAIEAVEGRSFA
jgi:acyl-CoA thioester hydrolase